MIKTFPLEFVRQALEQTLLKNHNDNLYYFGGSNQMKITSFYEQLKNQDEVNRFVETYRDLVDQQNRSGLIGNGILVTQENPTITNLYTSLIVPMTWTCSIRCKLADRDQMTDTLFKLIEELKGSKVDIAQLKCRDFSNAAIYEPFMVGTIGHNEGEPSINSGDYIGYYDENATIEETKEGEQINTIQLSDFLTVGNDLVYAGTIYEPSVEDFELVSLTCNYSMTYTATTGGYNITITITDGAIHPPLLPATITMDYEYSESRQQTLDECIQGLISSLTSKGITNNLNSGDHLYFSMDYQGGKILKVALLDNGTFVDFVDDGENHNIIFPPTHEDFTKYKVSLSFDSLRCDTPRTINGDEYCEISFGGSATLVNNKVKLGNDLVKVGIKKDKIVASTPISINGTQYWLEPLEMPSGNSANTQVNQLISNKFINNTHTDNINLTLQYTFVVDEDIDLIKQWFNYGRYGTQADGVVVDYTNGITPNMIYDTIEIWSNWGNVDIKSFKTKIIESIDIENTEGDTLTITLPLQIQGDNN